MAAFSLTGRRVAVLAGCWLVGVPLLVVARVITLLAAAGDAGGMAGFGIDILYLFSWPVLLLWLGPPLVWLLFWLLNRWRDRSHPPDA